MNYIIHPKNKKKYRLLTNKGINVLKKHINAIKGSGNIDDIVKNNLNVAENAILQWKSYLSDISITKDLLSSDLVKRIKDNIKKLNCSDGYTLSVVNSAEELQKQKQQEIRNLFKKYDLNKDGYIDANEFKALQQELNRRKAEEKKEEDKEKLKEFEFDEDNFKELDPLRIEMIKYYNEYREFLKVKDKYNKSNFHNTIMKKQKLNKTGRKLLNTIVKERGKKSKFGEVCVEHNDCLNLNKGENAACCRVDGGLITKEPKARNGNVKPYKIPGLCVKSLKKKQCPWQIKKGLFSNKVKKNYDFNF